MDIQLVKGKAAAATFQMSQAEQLVIDEFSDRTVASLSTDAERLALTDQLEAAMKKAYPERDIFDISHSVRHAIADGVNRPRR